MNCCYNQFSVIMSSKTTKNEIVEIWRIRYWLYLEIKAFSPSKDANLKTKLYYCGIIIIVSQTSF